MDPRYYTQPGPSSHYPQQPDNDPANQMQVTPLDNQAVHQYIEDLYRNPTRMKSGPTNDPAFYSKARHDLLGIKHRLEQMLLVNQQQAELAQMSTQISYASAIHPPPPHAGYINGQGAPPHPHGAWTGSASGSWTYQQAAYHQQHQQQHQQQPAFQQPYPQQTYAQPVAHTYPGQFVPDATMHDATYQQAQSIPQVVQLGSPQLYSSSHPSQPQPHPQHAPAHENPQSEQRNAPLPNVGEQPQPQPLQQTIPLASTSHTQNVHQPRPQPQPQRPGYSQRNPLQPGHQPTQASSSVVQKDRETTQKQLSYLQLLAQQHQRTQQQTRPPSHQSSPASSQSALPSVSSITNASGSDSVLMQPVPQLGPAQRSSSPQEEPLVPVAQVESVDAASPSPAKIRSRKPFALHDLRPGRRHSTAPSNNSSTPSREMNLPDNEGVNAPTSGRATPIKDAKPADNANHGSTDADPGPSQKPLTQKPVLSHNLLNTPSPLSQPVQIAAEPVSISVDTTSSASEIPNASAPALNNPTQPVPAPSSPANAGGSKMKIALENLHTRGVDCVALVRQAAQIAKVPVNTLPEDTGPVDPSVPLFARGRPLDVWTSNLQVTRIQGDAVVKSIWDLMKKKAREIGIEADVLKHPASEATNETPTENERVANYGNSIPPVNNLQVPSSSNDSAGHGASQHVTATQQPQITPSAANLSTEPRPRSTQPSMQTQATTPQPAPAPDPVPARPASAPIVPPEAARLVPTRQASNVPPSVQLDPVLQAQLAQRHQYNPYFNGAPPPQPVHRAPEQQQPPQAHAPAYVPPNLGAQTSIPPEVSQSQPLVQVSQSPPQSQPMKAKPRKTIALDYLRALGIITVDTGMPEDSNNAPSKPAVIGSEPTRTKDKGKGKATDVEKPAAPAQSEPSNNGNAAPEPAPPVNVAEPSQVPEMPPSPAAPAIAVLPEPSPTPPSPLSTAEDITRPMTPIAHSPVVIHTPTPVQPSIPTMDALDAPDPTQASAPGPVSVEAPPSPIPIASTANVDSAPRVAPHAPEILSPPIASISALNLNAQSSSAEFTPLKRKRESRPPEVIEAGPGPNSEERARQHANKHDQKRPKVAKRDSTTTSVGKKPSYPESPYPNIPRPDSPLPKNSWAQSYATAMNLANRSERPLFKPDTPPSSSPPKSGSKRTKRKMIMEVVIPVRKKKGKVAAADLTSDTGTERDEDLGLGLDELVHDIHDDARAEQEHDLKMLRRRLRPHMAIICAVGQIAYSTSRIKNGYGAIFQRNTFGIPCTVHIKANCDRTTSERYRMVVHVNRAHRGNPDAELRVFAQPEDFPPGRADPEEGLVLRPDAFPEGVPYFRIMGMALRYEIVPAQIPAQRHARIGPIILRNISAPTGFVSVPRQTNNRAPERPVLASPMIARPQVRLGTVPPDALGEELEREAGPPPNKSPVRRTMMVKGIKVAESSGKAKANPSPARSHITITSDESSPEPKNRRVSAIQGLGRGRGRGVGKTERPIISQSSQLSAPPKAPRYQLVVELPRGRGDSPRK